MVALRWGGTVGRTIQSAQMKAKDGRILLMNEILQVLYLLQILTLICYKYRLKHQNEFFQGMKVLKLYAWEKPLMGKVIVDLLVSE